MFDRIKGPIFTLFDLISGRATVMDVVYAFFAALSVVLIVIPFHEFAHALSAKLLGDDTAEREGRLTLNPFVHVDLRGFICIMLISFGWGKPVPVNPSRCRKVSTKAAAAITAAAGPVSNVILSLVCVIIARVIWLLPESLMRNVFVTALIIIAEISIFLAVFNLIPIPPLDGSKILMAFLGRKQAFFIERNMFIINWVFLLVLMFTDIFQRFIMLVGGHVMAFLYLITGFIK